MLSKSPTTTVRGTLDAPEVDALFQSITAWGSPDGSSRCVLDLSELQFMTPAGLTAVVQSVRFLKGRGWAPAVRFPEDDKVSHYLARMGLRRGLRGIGRCVAAPPARRSYAASTALVELTTIRDTGDVDALLDGLSGRVADILKTELGYSASDVGAFCNVISELSRNIIDHSDAVGYVAAQRYSRSNDRQKYALISVGDTGLGLRATLGQRYPVSRWTDEQVITNALLREYSRHPGRGLGLTFVQKVCQDYRGSLHIRSGACRLYLRGRRTYRVDSGWFPGTQIAISLQQKS